MGLNIKNERTHTLIKQAAELTGMTQTGVVEEAIRMLIERALLEQSAEREAAERQREKQERLARADRLISELQAAWREGPLAHLTREEIDAAMYDEAGLPVW